MMNPRQYWFSSYGTLVKPSYKKKLARYENNIEFQIQFNRGVNLHLDEFEWGGLPDTCNEEMIEKQLLWRSTAGFYKDPKTGAILSLGAGIGGRYNMYGKPTEAFLFGFGGVNFRSEIYWPDMDNKEANCVLIQDNYTFFPPIYAVEQGAKRIAKAKRNLDVAAANAKFPFILQCTEEQKKAILDIYTDIQENQPLIMLVKGNDITENQSMTMNTNVKEGILKELWDYYTNTISDVMNSWGINMNQNSDKKERMTITEVEGNTDFVKLVNAYRLRKRQEAAENANKLFGTNITVKFRHEDEEHDPDYLEKLEKGEQEDDEPIENNNN